MYLQIKKAELVKNQYWKNDIKITMVWLYDENWKRQKRVKLDNETLYTLLSGKSFLIPNLLQND